MQELQWKAPMDIERQSLAIIEEQLQGVTLPEPERTILKRVIHTTADFDYVKNLTFTENAVENAMEALRRGADIVTDTNMAKMGINQRLLSELGGTVHCFMADADVAEAAKQRGVTRAVVSMEKACTIEKPCIFAIGNAPTALYALEELVREGKVNPVLVIAVPVGFVNVCEAKECIAGSGMPSIIAHGNKGGSPVAAAICNAMLYQLVKRT